jgi:SAM-dependent methyltransferase
LGWCGTANPFSSTKSRSDVTGGAGVSESPQNIYDDPEFLAGYSQLDRFGDGWQTAMEHADFVGLLPDVRGLRVVDLGCGAGRLAVYLAERGAESVLAVDVSEQMLALARAHPCVEYRRVALEGLDLPTATFDLVVSSLAFHYVADYAALVRRIANWLVPGGVLVFSIEHPIYTARLPDLGWIVGADGQRRGWSIDWYGDEGARSETWFVEGVRKYHRTLATLVNGLISAGFVLERLIEPVPSAAWLADRPDSRDERRRPMFVLFRATLGTRVARA